MIKHSEPLSMNEVVRYIKNVEDNETDIIGFTKKFIKLTQKETNELRKKLEELDLIKVKPEHIVKIIDLTPENTEELNKIFTDVSLDEDETKKILEKVKEFK